MLMKKMLLYTGFLGLTLLTTVAADAQTEEITSVVYKKPVYCLRITPSHKPVKKIEKMDAVLFKMRATTPAENEAVPAEPKITAPHSARQQAAPRSKEASPTK